MSVVLDSSIKLIEIIDPNWLYSAIAQSSATIVGIIGAFLTTKLINVSMQIQLIYHKILDDKARISYLIQSISDKNGLIIINWSLILTTLNRFYHLLKKKLILKIL